mmetsp:Transcript_9376/g.10671  ORF Transcript_9376/g.10671 Transcript_9376/m.10671 type:complete len:499 (+) Transcript_9376:114-1610(+)|eukprot:CAMPEP_0204822584 /NCGR_PEP_ID=MMETSP1346-20131115/774_1 /ASSEMBLY_ACC=CAM_ASM_000771 /TAXON_ID=215587 /ORGANISM="Aplanochytrium stocchinoi, Strain GSBS06" /LENGTH=498 /DNA_ID=CAMNT_0051948869 /DNA_START=436 /DNA_END=1932 /DNA_ORIENTATION=+
MSTAGGAKKRKAKGKVKGKAKASEASSKLSVIVIGCNHVSIPLVKSFVTQRKRWEVCVFLENDEPRIYEGQLQPIGNNDYKLVAPFLNEGPSNTMRGKGTKTKHQRQMSLTQGGKTTATSTRVDDPYAERSYAAPILMQKAIGVRSTNLSVETDLNRVMEFYIKYGPQIVFFCVAPEYLYSPMGTDLLNTVKKRITSSKNPPIFCMMTDVPGLDGLFREAQIDSRFVVQGHPLYAMYRVDDGLNNYDRNVFGYNDDNPLCRIRYFMGNSNNHPVFMELENETARMRNIVKLYRKYNIIMDEQPDFGSEGSGGLYSFITESSLQDVNKKLIYKSMVTIFNNAEADVWFLPFFLFSNFKNITIVAQRQGVSLKGTLSNSFFIENTLYGCMLELMSSKSAPGTILAKQPLGPAAIGTVMQWISELYGRGNIFGDKSSVLEMYEAPLLLAQQRARMKRYVTEGEANGKNMVNCRILVRETRAASRVFIDTNLKPVKGFIYDK